MTAGILARAAGGLVLAVVLLVPAGCSGEKPAGTVTGTVRYNNAPVHAGDVNFLSPTGSAAVGKIDDAGKFVIAGALEAGEYKVYVTPPAAEPQPPGTKSAPKKFDLPAKFRDPTSSGVTATVKPGSNELVIDFKG